MTDDVVQHLAAVNILEKQVKMPLSDNHVSHATDVRMSEQGNNRRFTNGPDFSILILWPCGGVRPSCLSVSRLCERSRNDLDSNLCISVCGPGGCNLFASDEIVAEPDPSHGALAYGFSELPVA